MTISPCSSFEASTILPSALVSALRTPLLLANFGAEWTTLTSLWSPHGGSCAGVASRRSEEHTSELQSLMRISYAVFCLKKKNISINTQYPNHTNNITTI